MEKVNHTTYRVRPVRPGRTNGGFTLVELMVVVAIVAILAAIAYPNYADQVVQGRRATAASCLIEASQVLERRYTTSFSYAGADPQLGCMNDLANFYTWTFTLAPRTYTLSATPINGQARDNSRCGTLGINQAGVKTSSGPYAQEQCF